MDCILSQPVRSRRCDFPGVGEASYVGGLERQEENPTVDVLDRLAKTLAVHVSEFFTEPAKGAAPPEPLKSGRRPALQPRGKPRSRTG